MVDTRSGPPVGSGIGIAALLSGLAAWVLYFPTTAPSVTLRNDGGDSGELVRAAWVLGVPHPTGYPLWILIAHGATVLPFGEPAHRVALLSALAAAAGIALVALTAREVLLHAGEDQHGALALLGPVAGAALLATSRLYWQMATIPETYALDACLVAGGLWLLFRWLGRRGPLWPASLLTALALANHLVSLSLLAGLGTAIVVRRPRPAARELVVGSVPLLVTVVLYLFLMLRARAHPIADWGDPQTPRLLWQHVTAAEYGHFLTSRSPAQVALELVRFPARLRSQFTVLGAVIAAWSLLLIIARAPRAGAVCLAVLAVDLLIVARDAAPVAPAYLHVSYIVLAVAAGAGLVLIPRTFAAAGAAGAVTTFAAGAGAFAVAGFLLVQNRAGVDLHDDRTLERQATAALSAVPPDGILLTSGDHPLFALWYVQDVLGMRPDVLIWSINLVLDPWYGPAMHRRYPTAIPATLPTDEAAALDAVVVSNRGERPLVSVAPYSVLASRYVLEAQGQLYTVVRPR